MYEELIERLRHPQDSRDDIYIMKQAANAIAEMSRENESLAKSVNEASEILRKRWISVTERLPEKTGKYLVCGQWRGKPAETWVCDLIAFGKIKGWANEARNPAVTHWMPLPEPPKEETC